jgi:hypothetical protein
MHPNTMQHTKTWVYGPMGSIRCVRCEKLQHDFVARTFALIAPVHPVLHRVPCSYETIPNAPKHYGTHQNMSLGSNCVDRVRPLRKITTWFVARTLALIAPVHPVLHQVSFSYETIPNAPKHYATHQKWVYVPMGWIRCVRWEKLQRDFVARSFALIAPVNPFCTEFHAVTKRSPMHPNTMQRTKTWV